MSRAVAATPPRKSSADLLLSGPAESPGPTQASKVWERLFAVGSLTHFLAPPEAHRTRQVCREWRWLAGVGAWEEELWNTELGHARRGAAWKQLLLGGITLLRRAGTHQDTYDKLIEKESPFDSVIRRDVNRTLPKDELFREKGGKGQTALFRLLRALAIRLCDIGYCQSLNFIVATLIGVLPDDEPAVFQCALTLLLRHSLADLYRPKFPKLGVVVWQFDRIVEGFLPKVHAALVRHGVNSEYYGMQWFLTLFASDLPQHIVRRVWDRFLIAGWRIVVQVGLALLFTVQDVIPSMDTCQCLGFLKKFAQDCKYDAEELLRSAAAFKVSHRMLSALEAAYNWEDDVQLLVIKDLNSGHVHWAVQAVPAKPPPPPPDSDDEEKVDIPRAFSRNAGGDAAAELGGPLDGTPGAVDGEVLPFLLRNLDTGDEVVIDSAWSQYTDEVSRKSKSASGPAQARPSPERMPAVSPQNSESVRPEPAGGGSFWTQRIQSEAATRLQG